MTEQADQAEQELVHSIDIAAPITAVWAEITRLDGRQRAMMDTILSATLEAGAPLYYKTPDGKRVFIAGRIVEVTPPRRLSHTWRLLTRDDPWTLVTWQLDEVDGHTRVTLRHTGWPAGTKGLRGVNSTWTAILAQLKQLVETGDISVGRKTAYLFMKTFMWALPARTKAENVSEPA